MYSSLLLVAATALPILSTARLLSAQSHGLEFTVSNFAAWISSNNTGFSTLHFHVTDNHLPVTTDCNLQVAPGYSLYDNTTLWAPCDDKNSTDGFRYTLTEGQLVVKRSWAYDSGLRVTGFAPQGTYWAEGINKTTSTNGTQYTKVEDWVMPVQSLSSA